MQGFIPFLPSGDYGFRQKQLNFSLDIHIMN